jgi:mannose-6-phosphate isomerase-like protein (cupin superfamily)
MEYVNLEAAVKQENSSNCIAYEYPMQNSEINVALVEITQRYPDQGYAINHKSSEIGYILKGSGKLFTETAKVVLSCGDVVYIPRGEKYYWEGNMILVVSSTPAWHPEQHQVNLPAGEAPIPLRPTPSCTQSV